MPSESCTRYRSGFDAAQLIFFQFCRKITEYMGTLSSAHQQLEDGVHRIVEAIQRHELVRAELRDHVWRESAGFRTFSPPARNMPLPRCTPPREDSTASSA